MNRTFIVVFVWAVSALAQMAGAQEAEDSLHLRVYRLPEVVVTATRFPEDIHDAGGNVTLIDSLELRRLNPAGLTEVLSQVPGASLVQTGWWGQLSTIHLRGMRSEQLLVLRDGIPLTNPQNGVVDLNLVSPSAAERIEVVRGGLSSLYGANALGGVVNIISRDPAEVEPFTRVLLENGSFDSRRKEAEFSRPLGKRAGFYVFGGLKQTDGFRPNSDYKATDLVTRSTYELTDDWKLNLSTFRYHGELGLPGPSEWPSPQAREQDDRFDLAGAVHGSLRGGRDLSATLYRNDIRFRYQDPEAFLVQNEQDRSIVYGGELQQTLFKARGHRLVLGLDGRQSSVWLRAATGGTPEQVEEKLWVAGGFVMDQARAGDRMRLLLSARFDRHSLYGENWSPLATVQAKLGGGLSVFGSADGSFRAPTFNELFYPQSGNRSLKPERGRGWEAGVKSDWKSANCSASRFVRNLKDEIIWQPLDPQDLFGAWQPQNVQQSRVTGIEFSAGVRWGEHVGGTASFSTQQNRDLLTDKSLPQVPKSLGTLACQYSGKFVSGRVGLLLRASEEYVGRRYIDSREDQALPAYSVLNLKTVLSLVDVSAYLSLLNATDENYVSQVGYPMPGRSLEAGLTWDFWD